MQISVDGFVARPDGQLDWMTWTWDDQLKSFTSELTDTVDTILLGRKMTKEFVDHWEKAVKDDDKEEALFAKRMVDYEKYIFTKTLDKPYGLNSKLAKGDIVAEVNAIKAKSSDKDVIVYGGANFVSSLIEKNLIDELYLFVNPRAISTGMKIFNQDTSLELIESTSFKCGVVVNKYKPKTS